MSAPWADGPAVTLAVATSGVFFFTGLVLGVWKFRAMAKASDHRAPVYVDIAHRAALLYSFAALVLAKLAEYSPFPMVVTTLAVGIPLVCFGSAIATYIQLGLRDDTDNQFERRTFVTSWGIWMLIVGEIGGFAVLFCGFVLAHLS
ncbi:MAG: hypothetical protein HOW73_19525 [Polyangiaceae bacterium]|nr:hypothetical protein [Polyangiaceae bacterium]